MPLAFQVPVFWFLEGPTSFPLRSRILIFRFLEGPARIPREFWVPVFWYVNLNNLKKTMNH